MPIMQLAKVVHVLELFDTLNAAKKKEFFQIIVQRLPESEAKK